MLTYMASLKKAPQCLWRRGGQKLFTSQKGASLTNRLLYILSKPSTLSCPNTLVSTQSPTAAATPRPFPILYKPLLMALLVPLHPARQPHLGLQPLLPAHLVLLVMLVLLANPTLVCQSQCSRRLLQSRPPSTEEASIQWKPILARQSSTGGAMSLHIGWSL